MTSIGKNVSFEDELDPNQDRRRMCALTEILSESFTVQYDSPRTIFSGRKKDCGKNILRYLRRHRASSLVHVPVLHNCLTGLLNDPREVQKKSPDPENPAIPLTG
jgi:hypothetical protein